MWMRYEKRNKTVKNLVNLLFYMKLLASYACLHVYLHACVYWYDPQIGHIIEEIYCNIHKMSQI